MWRMRVLTFTIAAYLQNIGYAVQLLTIAIVTTSLRHMVS
jgi:hypothetical protein